MKRAILLLALLAAPALAQTAGTYDPSLDRKRYDGCVRAIPTDAKKAEQFAIEWQGMGGGLPARHCQALALMQQQQFTAAASTLSKAAQQAEVEKSPLAADFWSQAGNAAFLAGDNMGAVGYFTTALKSAGEFAPQRTANILLDRARTYTDMRDFVAARADLDKALQLNKFDPVAWMLSAALARRQGDIGRASTDIARASTLDSANPDILFEQGNVAAANKDEANARKLWEMTVKSAPGSPAAELAAKALAENKP
ncbi:tetratricopeptide repeat protein [Sandaracinobacteroides hominis]|uniref:tetratricopeptide repeat protein n=1 Tax=Sandaracinobacteroides hominis TaxID=2780086 RepID=UPI0018F33E10|nr:tetratricopeptide repeat protein [Sandaracinobacteroides hominis]